MRLAIVHGAYGSPHSNWFDWLAAQARRAGAEVVTPAFPTPDGQSLDAWLSVFAAAVPPPHDRTVVVGFSIGAALTVRVAAQAAPGLRAGVLVSGFWGALGIAQYDVVNASFFAPIDWVRARDGARQWISFAGSDDPFIPATLSQELSTRLGAERHVVAGGRHLDEPSAGMTTFPALLAAVAPLLTGAD